MPVASCSSHSSDGQHYVTVRSTLGTIDVQHALTLRQLIRHSKGLRRIFVSRRGASCVESHARVLQALSTPL
jgi:hypothetical protein